MDIAGSASSRTGLIRWLTLIFFLCATALLTHSQAMPSVERNPQLSSRIKTLADENHWSEIVRELEPVHDRTLDLTFYYGSALAQVGRLEQARQVFLAGYRLAPQDPRFPTELAGVEFKQKKYGAASAWLRRALRMNARDEYANDFVGTIYLLEGNLEAALKHWNRIGKPYIESVEPDHPLRTRPALFDRALTFSPAAELRLRDLETTRVRLQGLGVFSNPRVRLEPRPDGKFDAVLELQERNGWGDNLWEALISTFSGVAYQTLYPQYDNIAGSGTNVSSLVRWDAQKRRLAATLAGPLHQYPKWRYSLAVDLRNENWDLRSSFAGTAPVLGSLNLRRETATVGIDSWNTGRWGWSASAEFSHRDYRNLVSGSVLTPQLLLQGPQLKQTAQIRYTPLVLPEHRLSLNASASAQLARIWSQPPHAFAKLDGSAQMQWFPQAQGDDYALQLRARGGGTIGNLPFDELYMLGMERDNDLWMRAHIGTRDGRKGSAPLGEKYFLSNNEIDKNVWGNGLFTVKLSPFLDSGKITSTSSSLGTPVWLWDTGLQAKFRVLGVGLTFVYGKDLRTGNSAYYFTAGK